MSQELHLVAGLVTGVVCWVVLSEAATLLSEPMAAIVLVGGFLFGWLAWLYSPLPNRTIGPMATDTGGGYWGWWKDS